MDSRTVLEELRRIGVAEEEVTGPEAAPEVVKPPAKEANDLRPSRATQLAELCGRVIADLASLQEMLGTMRDLWLEEAKEAERR